MMTLNLSVVFLAFNVAVCFQSGLLETVQAFQNSWLTSLNLEKLYLR